MYVLSSKGYYKHSFSLTHTRAAYPLIEHPFQTFTRDFLHIVDWRLDWTSIRLRD